MTDAQALSRLARGMWTLFEPVHAVTYFAPECRAAFLAAGLRGFWRGYFAGRAAPLGRVSAAPVTALFCNFSTSLTARALPAVWDLLEPATALTVRAEGAAAALRRIAPESVTAGAIAGLADQLWPIAAGLDPSGRALGAANSCLPRPDDPFQALWQAATTLREHRGDGHVAAVVAADLTGLEIVVLRCAGDLSRSVMQPARGWTDDEWDDASADLASRGLTRDGVLSKPGWDALTEIEAITDRIAARAWGAAAESGSLLPLATQLRAVSQACRGALPQINPIAMPSIWDPELEPKGLRWSGG